MISFKRFITEGGNLTLMKDGVKVEAQRVPLDKVDVKRLREVVAGTALAVDKAYKAMHKEDLWKNAAEAFDKALVVSGSARLALDPQAFLDPKEFEEFKKVKKSLGDIDLQYPQDKRDKLKQTLDSLEGKKVGEMEFMGLGGGSPSQWNGIFKTPADLYDAVQFIQIDFEPVTFDEKGVPTEFEKFKFHSSWDDIKKGVKGAFTKYLGQSVIQVRSRVKDIVVFTKTGKMSTAPKWKDPGFYALSEKGVRAKLRPVEPDEVSKLKEKAEVKDGKVLVNGKPAYWEMDTAESVFSKDLGWVAELIFGRKDPKDKAALLSYAKMLEVLKKTMPKDKVDELFKVLLTFIWTPAAPKFYRDNPEKDREDKEAAVKLFMDTFPDAKGGDVEAMKKAYYENYK